MTGDLATGPDWPDGWQARPCFRTAKTWRGNGKKSPVSPFAEAACGQPNDTWIAACCLVYDLPLATLNVKDFADFAEHHGLVIPPM